MHTTNDHCQLIRSKAGLRDHGEYRLSKYTQNVLNRDFTQALKLKPNPNTTKPIPRVLDYPSKNNPSVPREIHKEPREKKALFSLATIPSAANSSN